MESNVDDVPFSREFRSVVYQWAKGTLDTRAFGTERDVNRIGYEWMHHTLAPKPIPADDSRLEVGGRDCTQPYLASHFNISANELWIAEQDRHSRPESRGQNGRFRTQYR